MKYNYRAHDRPLSRHVPALSYCAEQPISAGYLDLDFGHSRGYFQNQMDLRETIRRQIEKERIREEILAQEIARRRILEAEVRMELMREREAAMLRGQLPDERSLEERIVRLIEERLGVGISSTRVAARGENGRSQVVPLREWSIEPWTSEVPFRQQSVEPRLFELKPHSEFQSLEPNISEVKPAPELGKEKERIVFKAKPDGVSGVKRKMETPPEVAISTGVPKKKVKEEWSCALCQVSATSKDGLNEHLRGKKHKSKEAGLKAQRSAKNFSIGLFPKKPKPVVLAEMADDVKSKESLSGVVAMKGCPNGNDAPSLQINRAVDDSKEKNAATVQNKQKTNAKKRKKYKFWCEHCKIGAFSKKVMEDHKIGKKHLARVQGMKEDTTTEKLNDDDAKGTKKNRHKIGASSEDVSHRMSKEHSSPPQEMKCDSTAALRTWLDTATEMAIITQRGPEARSGRSAIQAVDAVD
nr:Zinc finger protein like [Ipomoea batatas]